MPQYWRATAAIFICSWILQKLSAMPTPQDPLEQFGNEIIKIANQAANTFQEGGVIRREGGFQLPFFSGNFTFEMGFGAAMRRLGKSDDIDDDDRRRRKREIDIYREIARNVVALAPDFDMFSSSLRRKRSPCGTRPSTGGTDTGDADYIDDVRRRSARMQARKRSANTKPKKTTTSTANTNAKSKTKARRRRRRQTELDDLDPNAQDVESNFNSHFEQFAENFRGIFESISKAMSEMIQRIAQTFSGDGATSVEKI